MKSWIVLAAVVVGLSLLAAMKPLLMPSKATKSGLEYPLPIKSSGLLPKAVIIPASDIYDFGVLPLQSEAKFEWILKNAGEADLKLKKGESSCSCTIASLPDGQSELTLKPGEQTPIELKWNTRDKAGPFQKHAAILTTDLSHDKIEFKIQGTVRPAVLVMPENNVSFDDFPNDTPQTQQIVVYSPDKTDFEIVEMATSRSDMITLTKHKLSQDDLDSLIKLEQVSSQAQDKERFKALAGYRVEVSIKAGSPIGPFREEILMTTNHEKHPKVHVIVMGRATGPITFSPGAVQMTHVSSTRGGKSSLMVFARGAKSVNFEVVKIPAPLKVSFARVVEKSKAEGTTSRYQMTLTVPPGTKPGAIHGTIELKTDHPQAPLAILPCDVIIEAH